MIESSSQSPIPRPVGMADSLAALKDVPVSIISDNLDRLAGPTGLRAFHRSGAMLGVALTVRTRAGDNLAIHQALEMLTPGDVLVVDGGGDESRALVGEIMKAIAESKGCVGFVIDGAIRDAEAFKDSCFPCFARAISHRGPYKYGPGEINVPVSVGGSVIQPGAIIAGDLDGVVAFTLSDAIRILPATRSQREREAETMRSIRERAYRGVYGAKSA